MIIFVYAQDQQGGIGVNNQLPWNLPNDLKFFRDTTMGHTILMGRKTFESLGKRLLPGRKTIVLSRDPHYGADIQGLTVITDRQEALDMATQEALMVIGGTEIFNLFWDDVNKIIRTNIRHTYECDTFMPPIDPEVFILETSIPGETNPEDPVDYAYEYWVRKDTPYASLYFKSSSLKSEWGFFLLFSNLRIKIKELNERWSEEKTLGKFVAIL